MLETQLKTIGGKDFQFAPLPVLKAARLDKRVIGLIVPVLSGLENPSAAAGGKMDINLDALSRALRSALEGLPDTEYEAMLLELLSRVTYIPSGAAPMELGDAEALDRAFSGDLLTMYKVAFEVMRFNKFTPFALAATGGLLKRISGFSAAAGTTEKSETGSAK